VAALLTAQGLRDFAVSAGGDVVTRGRARPDDCWRVGIQHPTISGAVAKVVAGTDLAIATSAPMHAATTSSTRTPAGPGRRALGHDHGPSLATADAYATAAFAMGRNGRPGRRA